MNRLLCTSVMAGIVGASLLIAPRVSHADKVDDFRNAANARQCRLSPYSGPREACQGHYRRASDRADKLDCRKFFTMGLIATLKVNRRLLKQEKSKPSPNRRRISDLKRQIEQLTREISRRKSKAKERAERAGRVVKNFAKTREIMGAKLSRRMKGDVAKARENARKAKRDKARHADLMRRYTLLNGFARTINGKAAGFGAHVRARQTVAQASHGICNKAYRGEL